MGLFKIFLSTVLVMVWVKTSLPQVAINTNGATADASAMLDVSSSVKGMLVPRMTTAQKIAITTPATGLLVFDLDLNNFCYYNGANWNTLSSGSVSKTNLIIINNNSALTSEGGFAIKLSNKSGNLIKKGTLVSLSVLDAGGIVLTGQSNSSSSPVGVVYEDAANNSDCWIVVSGIAGVLMKNNQNSNAGDRICVSDVNGRVVPVSSNQSVDKVNTIGYCLESKSSGTDVLVKIVLKF